MAFFVKRYRTSPVQVTMVRGSDSPKLANQDHIQASLSVLAARGADSRMYSTKSLEGHGGGTGT